MRKNKIYLDTSIISFIFADDSPEFREFTIDFFENYSRDFDLYISEIVLLEINKNSNENLKIKMLESIEKYNIKKEQKILIENMKMGYNYPLRLLSPLEVQNEE